MNKIFTIVILISVLTLICLTIYIVRPFVVDHFPSEGAWYCEELGIQLGFSSSGKTIHDSFILDNGRRIKIVNFGAPNSNLVSLTIQDSSSETWHNGDRVFYGEVACFDETSMYLEDYYTEEIYEFIRID